MMLKDVIALREYFQRMTVWVLWICKFIIKYCHNSLELKAERNKVSLGVHTNKAINQHTCCSASSNILLNVRMQKVPLMCHQLKAWNFIIIVTLEVCILFPGLS